MWLAFKITIGVLLAIVVFKLAILATVAGGIWWASEQMEPPKPTKVHRK